MIHAIELVECLLAPRIIDDIFISKLSLGSSKDMPFFALFSCFFVVGT